MLARDWVICIILFSLFAGIGGLIVYDLASADNGYNIANMTDSSFDTAYNKVQYAESITQQMGNATTSKEGLGLLGTTELFFGSTWTVITIVFGSLSMLNNVLGSFMVSFGIPSSLANLVFPAIIAIVTTILIFVIVSSLTKSKM
jgi:hypothetical protein